ncbi:DUF262 domain-containing protein [Chryseobacterium sp. RLHN22]|uniref:DUF262 domain-containing protein n=1 Tax=Chryseobacterium sp. RLHN22 TaxID=3437885 RepID=UPI003D9AD11F
MYKIYAINELGQQTIGKLYNLKDKIDFSPYYQRFGGIWQPEKKKLLIDTIINEFDIPKFYFNYFIETDNPLNINNSLYAVIDGKQRLQAIFDFLDNKYSLDSSCKIIENDISLNNYTFDKLLLDFPSIAKRIINCVLDVIFIVTDEDDRLEEMFLRLNGGIALTNAEKRNAINSYLNRKIRDIISENIFFTRKVKFKNPRFQYNDLLTKLLFIEYNKNLVNLGNKELEEFLRTNAQPTNQVEVLIQNTLNILDRFNNIFSDSDNLLKGKGIIPVYYQFIKSKHNASPENLNSFLNEFENIRIKNRLLESPNPILQEFDFFNQQGVHIEKSLTFRFDVINQFYNYFLEHGSLDGSLNTIFFDDDEADEIDNYDNF